MWTVPHTVKQRGCEESGTHVNSKDYGQLIKHIFSPKRGLLGQ